MQALVQDMSCYDVAGIRAEHTHVTWGVAS